jgi:hypothetical protein
MSRPGEDPELDALTASVIRAFLDDAEIRDRYRQHQERITGQPLSDDQVVAQLEVLLAYWERRDLGR